MKGILPNSQITSSQTTNWKTLRKQETRPVYMFSSVICCNNTKSERFFIFLKGIFADNLPFPPVVSCSKKKVTKGSWFAAHRRIVFFSLQRRIVFSSSEEEDSFFFLYRRRIVFLLHRRRIVTRKPRHVEL